MGECIYRGGHNGSGESRVEVHEVALEFRFPEESAVVIEIMKFRADCDNWPESDLMVVKAMKAMRTMGENDSSRPVCHLAYHNVRGMTEDAIRRILTCAEIVCEKDDCSHTECLPNRVRACRSSVIKRYEERGTKYLGYATAVNLLVTENLLLREVKNLEIRSYYDFGRPDEETRTDERSEVTQAVHELLLSQLDKREFFAQGNLDHRKAMLISAVKKTQIMDRASAIKDGKGIVKSVVRELYSKGIHES